MNYISEFLIANQKNVFELYLLDISKKKTFKLIMRTEHTILRLVGWGAFLPSYALHSRSS